MFLLCTQNVFCEGGHVYEKLVMLICMDMEFKSEEKCSTFSDKSRVHTISQSVRPSHPIPETMKTPSS